MKKRRMKKNNYGLIYKIINLINGKIYVGQTTGSLDKRIKGHLSSCKHDKSNSPLYNAIKKYGFNNFKYEIIGYFNNQLALDFAEIYYINHYKSLTEYKKGYNLRMGGRGGKHSEITKKRISKAHKGKKLSEKHKKAVGDFFRGRPIPQKQKDSISKAQKGKSYKELYGQERGENIKRKISKSNKGKKRLKGRDSPNFGLVRSIETRKKLSEVNKGKTYNEIHGEEKDKIIKEKMSKAHRGMKHTEKTKKKLRKPKTIKRTPEHTRKIALKHLKWTSLNYISIFTLYSKGFSFKKIARINNTNTYLIKQLLKWVDII